MKEELFKTPNGVDAFHADDSDPTWYVPSTNPFWHGCCNCGLMHRVDYRVIEGELQLRFTTDETETKRLRFYLTNRDGEGGVA